MLLIARESSDRASIINIILLRTGLIFQDPLFYQNRPCFLANSSQCSVVLWEKDSAISFYWRGQSGCIYLLNNTVFLFVTKYLRLVSGLHFLPHLVHW